MKTTVDFNRCTFPDITPPVALFDASHGQANWAQTGFPSRQMHPNFACLTEIFCRLGFQCRSINGQSLTPQLAQLDTRSSEETSGDAHGIMPPVEA